MNRLITSLAALSLSVAAAQAGVIASFTDSLQSTDSIQTGRLSRLAVAQDWSGGETFPGVINGSTSYVYRIYSIDVSNTPYIQISIDSLSVNTFVSAYEDSYAANPVSGVNWLGDAGSSGNSFGVDPLFFQVIVPTTHSLIIVVNQTAAGQGLGSANPFNILVEGFIDTEYTDYTNASVTTPEPGTITLSLGGLMAAIALARRSKVART